ncbi:hypothetical protein CEXT_14821 [Caerostris extrusa]|uniref:Uncharacterized protein n=1 Tax=Caerostris extrusa TaxID=172846 RepID=A0AAV4XPA2_CAEEX|nr:hypothetical protein CEXT_14821 [Caerostris extrusa]
MARVIFDSRGLFLLRDGICMRDAKKCFQLAKKIYRLKFRACLLQRYCLFDFSTSVDSRFFFPTPSLNSIVPERHEDCADPKDSLQKFPALVCVFNILVLVMYSMLLACVN